MKTHDMKNDAPDLEKEQVDLIALMEASITPQLLAAVENAYRDTDDGEPAASLDISYEGTIHA